MPPNEQNSSADAPPISSPHHTVLWFHDELTFYANDRRKTRWVHKSEDAVPYTKGEGASQMVANFVSADHGWLRSPDGSAEAQVLFNAGKNRDGYFSNDEILEQANKAMDILKESFPDEDHILVYDNARTHLKRASNALSVRHMPKRTSKPGSNWGVEVTTKDTEGKAVYGSDGKVLKEKINMAMAVILEERGLIEESKLRAECKDFKCPPGATHCCCRRALFNQPDFVNVESQLESVCEAQGFQVIFLPKFHCELNFIEQCWGYAKRIYHHYPASSKEKDLERNVLTALDSIPLESMRW